MLEMNVQGHIRMVRERKKRREEKTEDEALRNTYLLVFEEKTLARVVKEGRKKSGYCAVTDAFLHCVTLFHCNC